MLRNGRGDICEDTSLLHGRTSPMFSSLALGPTVPTLQTQPAPGKTRDGRVTIWSHSRCALRIEFKIPASMLSATTVLPTPGSGNTQRGPGPSPDLSTSAAQLSRRLGDNRDLQGTPQEGYMRQRAGFILHPTPTGVGIKKNKKGRSLLSCAGQEQRTANTQMGLLND